MWLCGNAFAQQNQSCETCHSDSLLTFKHPSLSVSSATIDTSVHAKFACVDCHYRGYNDYPHNKNALPVTCGECHAQQLQEYRHSSHYTAKISGNFYAPGCTDCHTTHAAQDPATALHGKNAIATCTQCHADKARDLGLKKSVVESFGTSYHGQMYNLGFEGDRYATCVSCHDNHSILGSDSPESTVAKQNLVKTCAQCHENANENFVGYLTHFTPEDGDSPLLSSAHWFMAWLFWGTMAFFGCHTFLWFLRTLATKGGCHPVAPKHGKQKMIRRFSVFQRLLHASLASSFLLLALTGLPLRFSDTPFAAWVAKNIVGFDSAALLHRIAGVFLIAVFVAHLCHLAFRILVKKEKGLLWGENSLVPNLKDFRDFFGNLAYFLFLRPSPPKFGRWTYWEKFDYFAVFWGMFIIGFSGIVLMFPIAATSLFPGWVINFAHIIHSEEALLATAFIFVVHFFNTHLRPNAFPLDDSIFTGRIPVESLKEERPLEYENLLKDSGLSSQEIAPLPKWKTFLLRAFGLALLLVGLVLLALILAGLIRY